MLDLVMGDPLTWLSETMAAVVDLGLRGGVVNLALAITWLAFAAGMYEVYTSFRKVVPLFVRVCVATLLITGVDAQRDWLYITWAGVYNWSNGIWATEVEQELLTATTSAAALTIPAMGIMGIAKAGMASVAKRVAGNGGAKVGAEVGQQAVGKAIGYLNWTTWLFIPLLAIYAATVYTSGLIVILAMVFLPLSGAFLVVPGGVAWITLWVRNYATALFTVVFMPIVFKIAVRVGLIYPLNELSSGLQTFVDDFNANSSNFWSEAGKFWLSPIAYLTGATTEFNLIGSVTMFAGSYLMFIGTMIVGMLIGAGLIMNVQRNVAAFIGSFGAGAGVPSFRGSGFGGGGGSSITNNQTTNQQLNVAQVGGQTGTQGAAGTASVAVEPKGGRLPAGSGPALPPPGGSRR